MGQWLWELWCMHAKQNYAVLKSCNYATYITLKKKTRQILEGLTRQKPEALFG